MKPIATPDNPIFQIRQKFKMTQVELAEALGCSPKAACRIEYGQPTKSIAVKRNLIALAEKMGIEENVLDDFFAAKSKN